MRAYLGDHFPERAVGPPGPRDAPGSMSVLDSITLERRGYDSLDDILGSLPGFDAITTNGTVPFD